MKLKLKLKLIRQDTCLSPEVKRLRIKIAKIWHRLTAHKLNKRHKLRNRYYMWQRAVVKLQHKLMLAID